MKRAALIVNPNSGRARLFADSLKTLMQVFAAHDFEAYSVETSAQPQSARHLAVRAAERCDLVIACDGDGTMHGVLQGLAQTQTALGVLPFGTANALARNLELPLDPPRALKKLLGYTARSIPLGLAESAQHKRWFTVMAGAGPDGTLVHEMKLAAKTTAGRRAYYTEAARLFLTRRFPPFQVEFRRPDSSAWETRHAVAMMASRIPDLGGLFHGLTTRSRLHHPHLLIHLLAAPAHVSLPAWLAFSRVRLDAANPWLTTIEAEQIRCTPLNAGEEPYAQIDGEPCGVLPLELRIVPSALRLMMP